MSHHDDAWWRHPRIRIRHDAHLWIRPDIARWMRGVDPADVFPSLARDRAQAEAAKQRARAAEDAEFDAFIARERRVQAAIQADLNEVNAELALWRMSAEAKYSPSQPRVPAGNPRGGQWTDGSGGGGEGTSLARPMGNVGIGDVSGSSELDGLFNIRPGDTRVGGVQLAGNLPDDPKKAPLDDPPPKVPQKEPETREGRMGFARDAARWIARNAVRRAPAVDAFLGSLDQVAEIKAITDAIKSANDPPKTLEELQEPVGSKSQGGYHDHHIVEEAAARDAGYPESLIQSRENRVRIPILKHIEITSYYSRKVEQPDGTRRSPRDQLKGKDFETRRQFGLDALRDRGVLK